MAMVPKMEKKRNGALYARTKANMVTPKPKNTPNMTEDLEKRSVQKAWHAIATIN